ncbi:conserved hypothetical protein [Talaromyces marneffei ATCC 18224]|uniref:Nucleoside phosphorylase domain-containing protein n=1 Tax=Talaromyces marneffei (strain ATCC 18224 / CBS 334.59 / QM 7333) TaxID=441960 RepID=B6QMZ6_TALMQ|nr:conserved hypothetical protein [Talaromyces marneffei ATCC 18224]
MDLELFPNITPDDFELNSTKPFCSCDLALYRTNSATVVAAQIQLAFPLIRFGLMVGIGGGVPSATYPDIRLGDVVVSRPERTHSGVEQYDIGKATPSGGFKRTGFLNAPPKILRNTVSHLTARHLRGEGRFLEYVAALSRLPTFTRDYAGLDILFASNYDHVGGGSICDECDKTHVLHRPGRRAAQNISAIHYGTVASGNQVTRNAAERDCVSTDLGGVLCFEMEAAGLMNEFPCLVIWGISDYSDSHKHKRWQPYAAGVAVAYAKELLSVIPSTQVRETPAVEEIISSREREKKIYTRSHNILPYGHNSETKTPGTVNCRSENHPRREQKDHPR